MWHRFAPPARAGRLLRSALLALALAAAPGPAPADGGRDSAPSPFGHDPVEQTVRLAALSLAMNHVLFTPRQIMWLTQGGSYVMDTSGGARKFTRDVEGGLFGALVKQFENEIFAGLERENFVRKVGRAYRIGDIVFIDTRPPQVDPGLQTLGLLLLDQVLAGTLFTYARPADPLLAFVDQNLRMLLFLMAANQRQHVLYQVTPKFNAAGEVTGAQFAGDPAVIGHAVFSAALSRPGAMQELGNVWQIDDKIVVAEPLDRLFPAE